MGQLTIDYPDGYQADLVAGLRAFLGEDAEGLTDTAASEKALKRFAKAEAKKVALRNATSQEVTDAEAALAAQQAAADAAVQARINAETASRSAVDTAFGADS